MSFVASDMNVTELGEVPADARLPTDYGNFRIRVFHEDSTGFDHVALTLGDMAGPDPSSSESTRSASQEMLLAA